MPLKPNITESTFVDARKIQPISSSVDSVLRPAPNWISRTVRRTAAWLILWTLIGVFFATQMIASSHFFRGQATPWSQVIFPALLLAYYCGLYSHLIKAIVRRFPLYRGSWVKALLLHSIAAVVFAAAYVAFANTVLQEGRMEMGWWDRFWMLLASFFHMQLMIYLGIAAVCQIVEFQKWARARDRQSAELKIQLANAQLNQLKSQLHPHFLFNTLNTITAFVHDDPDSAVKVISMLSELLRTVLDNKEAQTASFAQELEFIRKYMEIQQIRFGTRLKYREEIPRNLMPLPIPVLLLQPLVENAVQHGVAVSNRPCLIHIRASEDSQTLRIEIIDDGPGCDWSKNQSTGIGIQNTRDRIKQFYGDTGNLELTSNGNSGTIARLVIPLRSSISTEK